jgi:hypothetical protein
MLPVVSKLKTTSMGFMTERPPRYGVANALGREDILSRPMGSLHYRTQLTENKGVRRGKIAFAPV